MIDTNNATNDLSADLLSHYQYGRQKDESNNLAITDY
jgi:hypothetical protein